MPRRIEDLVLTPDEICELRNGLNGGRVLHGEGMARVLATIDHLQQENQRLREALAYLQSGKVPPDA